MLAQQPGFPVIYSTAPILGELSLTLSKSDLTPPLLQGGTPNVRQLALPEPDTTI